MPERWPAAMRRTTAAEYLDVSPYTFDEIARRHRIPAIQYRERGDRYYRRDELDALLETLAGRRFEPRS